MTKSAKKVNYRLLLSALFELAGVAALVWGAFLIAPFLGFIVGGLGLILIGLAVDPPAARAKKREER